MALYFCMLKHLPNMAFPRTSIMSVLSHRHCF
jgi:hypothetical protein